MAVESLGLTHPGLAGAELGVVTSVGERLHAVRHAVEQRLMRLDVG